jgi:hypothetical protein
MELVRALFLLLLSIPQVDASLPATPLVVKARTLLVRPGMAPKQVECSLGLSKYQWICGGNAGNLWFSTYLSPGGDHSVSVWYVQAPGKCEQGFKSVEIRRR